MLSRNSHAKAGLGGIQPGNKLRWVSSVSPHQRSVVAHVGGGQGEQRLACLVRRDGRDTAGSEARLGGLRFASPVVVGAAVGAAGAAVGAGSSVA